MPTPERSLTSGGSSVYKPIIYFAETRTVRHMHELCRSEATFQQQVRLTITKNAPNKTIWFSETSSDIHIDENDC